MISDDLAPPPDAVDEAIERLLGQRERIDQEILALVQSTVEPQDED